MLWHLVGLQFEQLIIKSWHWFKLNRIYKFPPQMNEDYKLEFLVSPETKIKFRHGIHTYR